MGIWPSVDQSKRRRQSSSRTGAAHPDTRQDPPRQDPGLDPNLAEILLDGAVLRARMQSSGPKW